MKFKPCSGNILWRFLTPNTHEQIRGRQILAETEAVMNVAHQRWEITAHQSLFSTAEKGPFNPHSDGHVFLLIVERTTASDSCKSQGVQNQFFSFSNLSGARWETIVPLTPAETLDLKPPMASRGPFHLSLWL